jgi:hypothetical protein
MSFAWLLNETSVAYFIKWSSFVKKHFPNTTATYLSMIKLIHELRKVDSSACNSFISKTLLKGAENLRFYEPQAPLCGVQGLHEKCFFFYKSVS